MRFSAPAKELSIAMVLIDGGAPPFTATVRGTARPATVAAVRAAILRRPMSALRTSALIRYQGVKLWLRGLPVHPRTPHDAPAGIVPTSGCPAGVRNDLRQNRIAT